MLVTHIGKPQGAVALHVLLCDLGFMDPFGAQFPI